MKLQKKIQEVKLPCYSNKQTLQLKLTFTSRLVKVASNFYQGFCLKKKAEIISLSSSFAIDCISMSSPSTLNVYMAGVST
jgi:hypothetical protein